MSIKTLAITTLVSVVALGTSACMNDLMVTQSQVQVERIEVSQNVQSLVYDRDEITNSVLARVVDQYSRSSEGGMTVLVAYPQDINGSEAEANRVTADYKDYMAHKGVKNVEFMTVGVDDPMYDHRVIFSYRGFQANAPSDCGRLTGNFGAESLNDVTKYQIGCEHKRALAKMISDPRDLLGDSNTQDADAKRAGNIVDRYRTGQEFEPLETSGTGSLGE